MGEKKTMVSRFKAFYGDILSDSERSGGRVWTGGPVDGQV